MLDILKPVFQGEWASYGQSLVCDVSLHASIPTLQTFLATPDALNTALALYADHFDCQDRQAIASAWALDYFAALLPPVIAAHTLLHHRFPVLPQDIALILDAHGKPIGFSLRHTGIQQKNTSPVQRYSELVWDHLSPLIQHVARAARLAPRVLWGSVPRYIAPVFERASYGNNRWAHNPKTLEADKNLLLDHPHWPNGRANPLFGMLRLKTVLKHECVTPITHYKHCCLYYRLPQQSPCSACPLLHSPHSSKILSRMASAL